MRCKAMAFFAAAVIVAVSGLSTNAAEQKKVSLEEAWKICKQDVDKALPNNADHASQRYARAGACMKKFGYPL